MYALWVNMADGGPWRQFFYEERDTRKLAEKIKEVLRDGGTVQGKNKAVPVFPGTA